MINLDEDVNWEVVGQAIEKHNLSEPMERDIRELVIRMATQWLQKDLDMFEIVDVEREHLVNVNGEVLKAVVDLECVVIKKNDNKIPVGSRVRLDWKTSALALLTPYGRQRFNELYKESYQWRLYSVIEPRCDFFIFRGASKADDGSYQVIQAPYDGLEADVTAFLRQGRASIESQKGASLPWLKNTKACQAFGKECAHAATCLRGTPEMYLVDPPPLTHLSYSSLEAFMTCNERYRRDRLDLGELVEDDSSDASRYGKAFHEAIAEVYKQFKTN